MGDDPVVQRLRGSASVLAVVLERMVAKSGDAVAGIADGIVAALEDGGTLLLCGNGGSAAQCQHLATELTCRFTADRVPYRALALTTDTSFLTACANDYDFARVFARQVEALGRKGDALLALSTGGRSPNVLAAVAAARARGIATFGLTGAGGAPLAEACDRAVLVPSEDPTRIQEAHLLLGHVLCGTIETRLGGFGEGHE